MKDSNQACVLALDVSRTGLETLLMDAVISDDSDPGTCKEYPVVVQWDPERFMSPDAKERKQAALTTDCQHIRSIQIGLRGGTASQALLDPAFVLKITDVTSSF